MAKLTLNKKGIIKKRYNLSETDYVVLHLKEIDFWDKADLAAIFAARGEGVAKLFGTVVGWENVTDDGNPPKSIPFSIESLGILLGAYPDLMEQVFEDVAKINNLFEEEQNVGNS